MHVFEADVWLWPQDVSPDRLKAARAFLAEDEIERATRLVRSLHRDRHIRDRAKLRQVLGAETGQDPRDITFDYGANGKPSIAGGPDFNLSHSGGLAALAISRDGALGIDIEKMRPIEDGVARHHFSAAEYAELHRLTPAERVEGFFQCWTRKEAIIKACGLGMAMPLASFDVSLTPGKAALLDRIEGDAPSAWRLVHFEPGAGWAGAIAARTDGREIQLNWREINR